MKLPSPEDSWAQVELYLRQHKELPPQDGTDKPLSVPAGLRGMAGDIKEWLTTKKEGVCPSPISVISVLMYTAKLIEQYEKKENAKPKIKNWKSL